MSFEAWLRSSEIPGMYASMEVAARRRRSRIFANYLNSLPEPVAILDVGGTVEYWNTVGLSLRSVRRIVLLNTFEQETVAPFESVVGDACDLSAYSAQEFDIVFSNSVINIIGGFAQQMKMAAEIRRVGKHFFVQTPNHGFPVDWRTLVPLFHLLPLSSQAWCFERFAVGKYPKAETPGQALHWAQRVRNLRRSELGELFPDAAVVNERILGLTKSFMVHNFIPARR